MRYIVENKMFITNPLILYSFAMTDMVVQCINLDKQLEKKIIKKVSMMNGKSKKNLIVKWLIMWWTKLD